MATINNGESGASVRSKINAAITVVDTAGTVGANIFALADTAAQKFLRINSDGSVSQRTGAELITDLYTASNIGRGVGSFAVASGTNTYTATFSPVFLSLAAGVTIQVLFTNANTAASPTLNIDSLGAKTLKKAGSTDLDIGDISAGTIYTLVYDGTNWQVDIGINGKEYSYVTTLAGWSANPTISFQQYVLNGVECTPYLRLAFNTGTSNATTATFTLPFNAKYTDSCLPLYRGVNGGVALSTVGLGRTTAASNVVDCFRDQASTAWTASTGKTFTVSGASYIIAT